jgi:S-adenosyl-L-methionine hydrolase (adenosine-forming)
LQGAGALGQAENMIVLFSDFGLPALYGLDEGGAATDGARRTRDRLFADAPVGNPEASAYLLAAYAERFPEGTVFLCVVDPRA